MNLRLKDKVARRISSTQSGPQTPGEGKAGWPPLACGERMLVETHSQPSGGFRTTAAKQQCDTCVVRRLPADCAPRSCSDAPYGDPGGASERRRATASPVNSAGALIPCSVLAREPKQADRITKQPGRPNALPASGTNCSLALEVIPAARTHVKDSLR